MTDPQHRSGQGNEGAAPTGEPSSASPDLLQHQRRLWLLAIAAVLTVAVAAGAFLIYLAGDDSTAERAPASRGATGAVEPSTSSAVESPSDSTPPGFTSDWPAGFCDGLTEVVPLDDSEKINYETEAQLTEVFECAVDAPDTYDAITETGGSTRLQFAFANGPVLAAEEIPASDDLGKLASEDWLNFLIDDGHRTLIVDCGESSSSCSSGDQLQAEWKYFEYRGNYRGLQMWMEIHFYAAAGGDDPERRSAEIYGEIFDQMTGQLPSQ